MVILHVYKTWNWYDTCITSVGVIYFHSFNSYFTFRLSSPKHSILDSVVSIVTSLFVFVYIYTRCTNPRRPNLARWHRIFWSQFGTCGWGYRSLCSDSQLAGRSGDRIPIAGEIFRARTDPSWGPPSLLYKGYRVSFPWLKRRGCGANHPLPSSAEVE